MSEVKIPGDLENTFAEDEMACIVVGPTTIKPKMHPKKLIITTKRAIVYKAKVLGHETRDIPLESITNIEIKKGIVRSTIKIHIGSDDVEIEDVANDDAEQAVSILKTNIHNLRKSVHMPSQINQSTEEDPVSKLKQLKEMLDAGLIAQEEYDQTKASILSRM